MKLEETEYENGVLICKKHKTIINKKLDGTFFCRKCQRNTEPKLCICCEEITEENAHLHRNCGK